VQRLPLDKLLIETDGPFLTPHPHRGKRNEPAYVKLVAEKIGDLKNKTMDEVARTTTYNAARLFKWS
jgi:TatD DNase family protein